MTGLKLDHEGLRVLAGSILDDVRQYNIREGLMFEKAPPDFASRATIPGY
jgi:hypothetical protein